MALLWHYYGTSLKKIVLFNAPHSNNPSWFFSQDILRHVPVLRKDINQQVIIQPKPVVSLTCILLVQVATVIVVGGEGSSAAENVSLAL